MSLRTRILVGVSLVLTTSVITSGAAAAQAEPAVSASVARGGVATTHFTTLGGDYIEDCYYSGGYRGCTYFFGYTEPFEKMIVCDLMADGRYTKGQIKFYGGIVDELGPVRGTDCQTRYYNFTEGTHVGIHTGVEGLGWTEYEYGYA